MRCLILQIKCFPQKSLIPLKTSANRIYLNLLGGERGGGGHLHLSAGKNDKCLVAGGEGMFGRDEAITCMYNN